MLPYFADVAVCVARWISVKEHATKADVTACMDSLLDMAEILQALQAKVNTSQQRLESADMNAEQLTTRLSLLSRLQTSTLAFAESSDSSSKRAVVQKLSPVLKL